MDSLRISRPGDRISRSTARVQCNNDGTITITGSITFSGNLTLADDGWIGLGSAKGRIVFDDTTTDLVKIMTGTLMAGANQPSAPVATEDIGVYSNSTSKIMVARSSTDTSGAVLILRKTRGTIATPTAASAGDDLGYLQWDSHNDAARSNLAYIVARAATGWAATGTDTPSEIVFGTTPDGSSTSADRWKIDSSGHLLATTDNAYDIGASGDTRPKDYYGSGIITLGTSPAAAGQIRLPNNTYIAFRNAANNANVAGIEVDTSDQIRIGSGASTKVKIADNSAGKIGFFGAAVASRPSAYTPTNVSADRAYDANATTTDELADVLGTLIADLQTLGLLQ